MKYFKNKKINIEMSTIVFFISIFLLILIKLTLVMGYRMYPILYSRHDDMLMYSRAVSISNFKWLGGYDNVILAKGTFFSLWLALLNLLSIPMLIGNEMLYIASCLFLIWCINTIVANKKLLFFVFAILLFNPVTLGYVSMLRIYRDGIFPALIVFVFAGIIGMFLKKVEGRKMLICSCLAGIFLSAAWHTREDTFWVLPFVIVADVVIAIFIIAEKRYKDNIKKYIFLILPFIILLISNLFVSSLNYIWYGRFITNDYMSKDFQGAYGALTRVAHEKFDYLNPVPEEVRMKIYQFSPAFSELRPYLDGGPFEGWKDFAKNFLGEPLHDYYLLFMWVLRDAVAACGYYENPQKVKEYYERLAKEVNSACDAGLLPSRTKKRETLASPFSREYITPTIENAIKATKFIIKYENLSLNKIVLPVKEENFLKIREIEFYLNQLSCFDFSSEHEYSKVEKIKNKFSNYILIIYKQINPVMTLSALLSLLILTYSVLYSFFKKMENFYYKEVIILWGLLLAFFCRIAMIAYVSASSFPAVNIMYLSSSYPVMIIFNCISLCCIFNFIKSYRQQVTNRYIL